MKRRTYFKKFNEYNYKYDYCLIKHDKDKIKKSIKELQDIKFELETIKKLRELHKERKKRTIRAVMFIALFVLCFELSLFIITGVIGLNPTYSVILGIIGTIFLSYGIYLMICNPPIYVE